MNNNPILYEKCNKVQRLEVQRLLAKYSPHFKWRSDGTDSLLDIGCGGAGITIDLILPILPEKFERLVGVDVSTEMIEHARKKYSMIANVSFEQHDLEVKLEHQSLCESKQFDVITSFYCLVWVQNQKNALRTISKLLKLGGCALLVLPSRASTFTAFERLVKYEKWAKYMQDFRKFIPIYYYAENPAEEMRNLLLLSGFSEFAVDVVEIEYNFSGPEEGKSKNTMVILIVNRTRKCSFLCFTDFYRSISPFIDRIPTHEQDMFLNDMFAACDSKLTFQELIVFAKK